MSGEKISDQPQNNHKLKYEIEVHNIIFDQIITSLEKRFISHSK